MILLGAATLALGACGGMRNPSFDVTLDEARDALDAMKATPVRLERPVVVLGGFADPGVGPSEMARRLRSMVSNPELVLAVAFFAPADFDECRTRVVTRVQEAWPSADEGATVAVDAVAISMGGLVARYAACEALDGSRRLRVQRLFTVSTPHDGADMAALPSLDQKVLDMRPGSAFLALLDAAAYPEPIEIVPYTRLGDSVVGEENTSPDGLEVWWVPTPGLQASHLLASRDERILADIARRLRGEDPFTVGPPASLP